MIRLSAPNANEIYVYRGSKAHIHTYNVTCTTNHSVHNIVRLDCIRVLCIRIIMGTYLYTNIRSGLGCSPADDRFSTVRSSATYCARVRQKAICKINELTHNLGGWPFSVIIRRVIFHSSVGCHFQSAG